MNRESNLTPDYWKNHFDLGMKYGSQGKLRKAARSFSKAIESAPNEPYPHYELGYTLTLLGDFRSALREFLRADDISPAFLQVQTEIYICRCFLDGAICCETIPGIRQIQHLIDIGQFSGSWATEMAVALIKLAPNCPLSYYYLSIAMADSEPAIQESALRRCLALNPDDTTAIYASARLICLLRADYRHRQADELCDLVKRCYADNNHLSYVADILFENSRQSVTRFQEIKNKSAPSLNRLSHYNYST